MADRLHTSVRLGDDAGRRAYEAHVARNGRAQPWHRLSASVQEHWTAVAAAVLSEVKGDAE